MSPRYTSKTVRWSVDDQRDELFASYAANRPKNWTCDQRTKDTVCLSVWLRQELTNAGIDEEGRKAQENVFYRYARNDDDLFALAAELMNKAFEGDIERGRKPHRRWG